MERRTALKAIGGLLITPFLPAIKADAKEQNLPTVQYHIKAINKAGKEKKWALGVRMEGDEKRKKTLLKSLKFCSKQSFEHFTPDIMKFLKE
uniref:Uncharacterized protein n=1 Tax=viral metagenome TaxID=1070528 RepID=A0A6M3L060_9ZZZZ